MIRCGIAVTTVQFEAKTPQTHFINERCFGEDFATWLRSRLEPAVTSVSDPIAEDWGWALIVEFEGINWTIAIGIADDSIGQTPAAWHVNVAYEKGLNGLRALFRKKPVEALERLFKTTLDILTSDLDPNARSIQEGA
jgi:hypothetical protein